MRARELIDLLERTARAAVHIRGLVATPVMVFIHPEILQWLSKDPEFWELPQVSQAQIGGSFRIVRRLRLETGIVEVQEDPNEPLFRFE